MAVAGGIGIILLILMGLFVCVFGIGGIVLLIVGGIKKSRSLLIAGGVIMAVFLLVLLCLVLLVVFGIAGIAMYR